MQPVGLSSSREGSAQPLFGQVTAISVQSVKVGNLGSKHRLDGFSLVHHSGGGIEPGIVRATGPRREFAANELYDLLLETSGVAGYVVREVAPQACGKFAKRMLKSGGCA